MRRAAETVDSLIDWVGLSLAALAKRASMSERTILAMRKGETARVRVDTVARLAKALGVDTARLRAAIAVSRAGK